ncbi:Fc.00g037170.m01.CDS01 [Cosmosporella sp. VM-42]
MSSSQSAKYSGKPNPGDQGSSMKPDDRRQRQQSSIADGPKLPNPPIEDPSYLKGQGSKKWKADNPGESSAKTPPFLPILGLTKADSGSHLNSGQLGQNNETIVVVDHFGNRHVVPHGCQGFEEQPSNPGNYQFGKLSGWCPCGGRKVIRDLKDAHQKELERRDRKKISTEEETANERNVLLGKINSLEQTINGLHLVIQQAQLAGAQDTSQGVWISDDEGELARALKKLNTDIRNWAKTYCCSTLHHLKNHEAKELIDHWVTVADIGQEEITGLSKNFIIIVLTALLSKDIFVKTFGNPAFFLDFEMAYNEINKDQMATTVQTHEDNDREREGNQKHAKNAPDVAHTMVVYSSLLAKIHETLHPIEGHQWRAQTFRLLFPKPAEPEPFARLNTAYWIQRASAAFTEAFIDSPARYLLFPADSTSARPNRLGALENLYFRAGELSTSIQRYLPKVEIKDPTILLGHSFSVRDPFLEAHRLHGLEDDDDDRHDGRRISLVLNPAICISGNDDGEGYDTTQRVLVRSCVLLDGWANLMAES